MVNVKDATHALLEQDDEYFLVSDDGEILEHVSITVPNGKWDWYLMGGRWAGSLKLKDGATGLLISRHELMDSSGKDIDPSQYCDHGH